MANVVFGTKTSGSSVATLAASKTLGHVTFNTGINTLYYGTGTTTLMMNGIPNVKVTSLSGKTSSTSGTSTSTYYETTVSGIVLGVFGITGMGGIIRKALYACTPQITLSGTYDIKTKVRLTVTHAAGTAIESVSGVVIHLPIRLT